MKDKHLYIAEDSALLKTIYRKVEEQLVVNTQVTTFKIWIKFIFYFSLTAFCYSLLYTVKNPYYFVVCFILYGFISLLFAFNFSHDFSHNTVFERKKLNNFCFIAIYTIVGAHGEAWKQRHIHSHHYAPNVEDYDSDLGLFAFSNYFQDSIVCDDYGKGFCAFIAEPAPNPNADVIDKVFTLIIDRSGSMGGSKMQQAKDAAKFIMQNLNEGDKFNIVEFDDQIHSFRPDHVPLTATNLTSALNFIELLDASGTTNISGAFGEAIPHFANDLGDTYNVIIFLTDGEATAGITSTPEIISFVQDKIAFHEVKTSIFCFGIGDYVNEQLLTLLSNKNQGIATFVANNELQTTVTEFYLTLRNPVLLNTTMAFTPALVTETYPNPLPNLFKGVQMLVVGRYETPGMTEVKFDGEAFGNPVSYIYPMPLVETDSQKYHFLPKLWAKQKTEKLLQDYYASADPALAEGIKEEIVSLSRCYGVITPFTSFVDNGSGGGIGGGGGNTISTEEVAGEIAQDRQISIVSITPNPAHSIAQIKWSVQPDLHEQAQVCVLDPRGVKVTDWTLDLNGGGTYTSTWNLVDNAGKRVVSGAYWVLLQTSAGTAIGKIIVR